MEPEAAAGLGGRTFGFVDDAFPGVRGGPPVGGRVEEAREQGGAGGAGEDPVEDVRLVGHAAEAVRKPVGV